jgi:hypothetical protein
LVGAQITGRLDLRDTEIRQVLRLHACHLDEGLDMSGAVTRRLELMSCYLRDLDLADAQINGTLDLSNAKLKGDKGKALNASGMTVAGSVLCLNGFEANGELRLLGAKITGQFVLNGANLINPGGIALSADKLTVEQGMFCASGFRAEGMVRLVGASIGGQLSLRNALLINRNGVAFGADRIIVDGSMFCSDGFQAEGEVRLLGARIGDQLALDSAHLANADGYALNAEGMTVNGSMLWRNSQTYGEVLLRSVSVGAQLSLNDTQLINPSHNCLNADRIAVAGSMFLDGCRTEGQVRLVGASISGQLAMKGAHLINPDSAALVADGITVIGEVFCDDGFQAEGEIRLSRGRIRALRDDPMAWPARLTLDGLTYSDLVPYLQSRQRLKWLRHMQAYRAQPYEELAAYYRRLGHDEQARRVLLGKLRMRTRERPWWAQFGGHFQDFIAGYGYAPGRAAAWLAAAFIGGWIYFCLNRPVPVKPQDRPRFHAALYTLDLILPAPGLGQEQAWTPHDNSLVFAAMLQIIGWLLTIAVVASITRVLSRS